MFFSIIIPIYNSEKKLNNCLNSLLNQKFKDFEAIMINDGSVDLSGKICKKIAEKDTRFIYVEQQNCGVSITRNRGIELARGEYLVFLDSDDEYSEEYLQAFFDIINQNPEKENYWCGFEVNTGKSKYQNTFSNKEVVSIVEKDMIMTLFEKWQVQMLWNKAFKTNIVKKYNLHMKEDLSLGEDLLFVFDYLSVTSKTIIVLNLPLYCYNQMGETSLDRKYRNDLKEIYDILDEKVLSCLKKWEISEEQLKKYYNTVFYNQEKIMRNTFRKECQLSLKDKIKFNNEILKSDKFRLAVQNSNCFIHPVYRYIYNNKKNYLLIWFIDKIIELKKHI